MSDGIETTTDGPILEVRLNRPKANAIDLAASRRLNDVFTSFRDDPQLRVAIVTGAGDRFFSAGWDLKAAAGGEKSDSDWGRRRLRRPELPAQPRQTAHRSRQRHRLRRWVRSRSRNRHHRDGGARTLRAPGNQRWRSRGCRHDQTAPAHPVSRRRGIPDDGTLDGRHRGETLGPGEHVVPAGQSLAKAREIAKQLASGPPLLFPAIKQLLRHTEMVGEHESFELHDALSAVQKVLRSDDLLEGARAFSEKRPPNWTGK